MPALPVCLLDPLWSPFRVLLPTHPAVVPTHPLGCHRRRSSDRIVFDHSCLTMWPPRWSMARGMSASRPLVAPTGPCVVACLPGPRLGWRSSSSTWCERNTIG